MKMLSMLESIGAKMRLYIWQISYGTKLLVSSHSYKLWASLPTKGARNIFFLSCTWWCNDVHIFTICHRQLQPPLSRRTLAGDAIFCNLAESAPSGTIVVSNRPGSAAMFNMGFRTTGEDITVPVSWNEGQQFFFFELNKSGAASSTCVEGGLPVQCTDADTAIGGQVTRALFVMIIIFCLVTSRFATKLVNEFGTFSWRNANAPVSMMLINAFGLICLSCTGESDPTVCK